MPALMTDGHMPKRSSPSARVSKRSNTALIANWAANTRATVAAPIIRIASPRKRMAPDALQKMPMLASSAGPARVSAARERVTRTPTMRSATRAAKTIFAARVGCEEAEPQSAAKAAANGSAAALASQIRHAEARHVFISNEEQWQKLLAMTDEIRAFLREHDAELKAKE